MERLYTVAETVRLAGWGDGNSQGPARQLYMRAYARAYRACGMGHAPGVRRTGRLPGPNPGVRNTTPTSAR